MGVIHDSLLQPPQAAEAVPMLQTEVNVLQFELTIPPVRTTAIPKFGRQAILASFANDHVHVRVAVSPFALERDVLHLQKKRQVCYK